MRRFNHPVKTYFTHLWTIKIEAIQSDLEVAGDPVRAEALGDDHHASLDVEAQGHLGAALVVLSPDGDQDLVLQERRAFQVHPGSQTRHLLLEARPSGAPGS